jgi:hypothetical protein
MSEVPLHRRGGVCGQGSVRPYHLAAKRQAPNARVGRHRGVPRRRRPRARPGRISHFFKSQFLHKSVSSLVMIRNTLTDL